MTIRKLCITMKTFIQQTEKDIYKYQFALNQYLKISFVVLSTNTFSFLCASTKRIFVCRIFKVCGFKKNISTN